MRVLVAIAVAASLLGPGLALAQEAKNPPPASVKVDLPPASPKKKEVPPPPPATPDRIELARQILTAQGGPTAFNAMLDGFVNGCLETLKPAPMITSMIAPYKDKILGVLHTHMPAIVDAFGMAWARAYSADELKGQLAWYASPAGQSIARKLPGFMGDLGRELGWVVRQLVITDPKSSQYLADVKGDSEAPLAWAAPAPASEAKIRAIIAEADKNGEISKAFAELKKGPPPGLKNRPGSDKMTKKVFELMPQVGKDLIAMVGATFTEDEIQAQMDFAASPNGKATAAGAERLEAAMKEEFKPVIKPLSQDIAAIFKAS